MSLLGGRMGFESHIFGRCACMCSHTATLVATRVVVDGMYGFLLGQVCHRGFAASFEIGRVSDYGMLVR
jgi:hypothetical protein